ncbi:ankyrin repeat domain-containing protein 26-like isoform X6 [Sminthopsis crassicaudata]|uniref:ankyrin repeat domain-containing protein 26-like isoform X6 n=1 Tax=Sminthopsis crassicaudata TaxID=9301 RepID=UPI003D6945A9
MLKIIKKPEKEKWISKDSSMTCENVNSSSDILLHSHDDSTLSETDFDELRLVKKTLNENNKDKGEMAADTLDDLTQSLETNTEYCNLPPSNHIKDSVDLWEYQEEVLTYKSSVKFKKSQWTQLKRNNKGLEEISGPQAKFSEGSKTKSQLRHYNVECDRELYGGRLEDIKQSRERLQREMDYPSCVSSAIRDHEHPTSKLNIQQIQDELLPLKNKLLIQLSKAENERYQLRDSLREKTLMLEITQRKLNQLKDKIKEHEDQIHTENEKLNRSFLRQESIPEVHTHMQSENEFLRKPFKDAPNKGVFKVGTSDCVLMQYKNNLYTDTGELDAAIEEQNKNSAEEYIRLRERLHKLEKEKAERLDTIRKLQQLPDFQKEQFMTSKSKIYEEILKQKQLQKELDESKRNLQESQEEYQQKQKYIKELEDYIQKLNMKHATFEDSVKQHMGKSEKNQKNSLCSPLIQELEAEVLKMQISHQEAKAKLERCKKDFSQEYRFTTNPFVEPLHDLVLDNYMGLSGRNSKYFMGETETSINSMEACFAKMQEELESPVTTIDAELPSTSFWASPMEYTRRPNLN